MHSELCYLSNDAGAKGPGQSGQNVTLDEFIACPSNLASNRQTRMLANLSLVNCYEPVTGAERVKRERIMLRSAKDNLRQMAFFGQIHAHVLCI